MVTISMESSTSDPTTAPTQSGGARGRSPRVAHLDWLRILAVLLLIPFHSGRVFDIFEAFYVKNSEASPWISWAVIRFLNEWQMPLLFLIAGASTFYALRSRSGGGYLRERLKRLMVPFVFGTLVLVPPQMYYALLHRNATSRSFLTYYPSFFSMRPAAELTNDYSGVGFTYAHLWFILDLFVIAGIALPLFLSLKGSRGQRLISALASFFERRGAILLPALALPLVSVLPNVLGAPFAIYLVLFVFGFLLVSDERFQRGVAGTKEAALVLAVLGNLIMYSVWLSGSALVSTSPTRILTHFLFTMNTWFCLVAMLGYGQRYLTGENRVLRYAREAAYPFYILQQTVIVAIAYYVVRWPIDLNLKYIVLVVTSMAGTVALYDLVVKRTNLTRWLFGMKPVPPADRVLEVPQSVR